MNIINANVEQEAKYEYFYELMSVIIMKFEEEEVTQFIQNDVLETYQKISVTIFHNRILRIILCFIFSALITLELIQTYMFLKKFESIYFIQYGSLYFGVPYILLCAATIPYSLNVVENVFGKVPLWKLDCADDKTEKQIKKEARFLNGFIICFAILGLICVIAYMIPDPYDKEIIYPFALFAQFPEWENILSWCFRLTFPFIGLLMMTPYCQVIYCCSHIQFQIYLFICYIKKLDMCFEMTNEKELFYNEDYQREIEKRLVFCIKHHTEFYKHGSKTIKKIKNLIILYAVIGSLTYVSFILYCITFQNILVGVSRCIRIGALDFLSIILPFYVIKVGQGIEDMTSEIFETLIKLKWYNWNNKNKKMFLIFLLNIQKAIRIQFSENISINYDLGASVAKGLYSILSVMSQIKNILQSH